MRGLKKQIDALCRALAVRLVQQPAKRLTVREADLHALAWKETAPSRYAAYRGRSRDCDLGLHGRVQAVRFSISRAD
ncbi:MAG: hypothetical protein ACLUUO_15020 [Sellimonas intestinalis]